ncbi:MAG: D-alanyl-D-alanine carboxypeptidase [Oscillospiraceae bacterium]|nr:D-alanyl-D-alanine carboxypeptidase [Oscillospiraceae bacterium]
MKKLGLFCLTLCLITALMLQVIPVFAEESGSNNTVLSGAHSLDGQVPFLGSDRLVTNVQSAIVYETKSQTLMYAFNADEQVSPASFVKILTALLVAERANLSDAVVIKEATLNTVADDAVSVDLLPDEVMTVEDLLYCMMVGSGNDAAAVLAEHISGSQSKFVEEMNQYAANLGCTQTNFTNAHGLHDDMQYTTARDMARILAKAMENEIFSKVFGTVYYKVPATNLSEERSLATGNFLMNNESVQIYHDSRVTGGRTAVTSTGYNSIATSAEDNGMQLICIVTGSLSVYKDDGYTVQTFGGYKETSMLLNSGFEGFEAKQVVYAGQSVAQYAVENGTSDVVVGATNSVYTVLPADAGIDSLDYRLVKIADTLTAPVEKGQVLSALEVWYGNICVAHIDLCAMNSVPVNAMQTDGIDSKSEGFPWKTVFTVVVCVFIGIGVILILIRSVNSVRRAAARSHSRKRRRSRRRSR